MEKSMKSFLGRYKQMGQDVSKFRLRPSLRVNTLKISEEDLIKRLEKQGVVLEKIPFTRHGYYYSAKFSLGAISEYLLGYFYLQEAAAQLPAEILDPKAGDIVLDCCAAPGGKTTQMAQMMGNEGILVALEKKPHRIVSLKTNLERTGASNVLAYNINANNAKFLGMEFDKVLLDAPCSGNFVTDSKWFGKRKIEDFQKSAEIQKNLIKHALSVLKQGGVMVYSTCSLEPEENEFNMHWMLDNFDVKLEEIGIPIGSRGLSFVLGKHMDKSLSLCKRFWPNNTKTQGFFIAKVRKL